MNTGSKLAMAGVVLIASAASLPAVAAPIFFQDGANVPLTVAVRSNGEFKAESSRQDERKAEKRAPKKEARKDERATESTQEHESDQPGYGYGYERRYPVAPIPPSRRFDDHGRR